MRREVLSGRNLTFHNRAGCIISNVSLHLYQGEILGIVGINGPGKTILAQLLAGILQPDSGKIVLGEVGQGEQSSPELLRAPSPELFHIPCPDFLCKRKEWTSLSTLFAGYLCYHDNYSIENWKMQGFSWISGLCSPFLTSKPVLRGSCKIVIRPEPGRKSFFFVLFGLKNITGLIIIFISS